MSLKILIRILRSINCELIIFILEIIVAVISRITRFKGKFYSQQYVRNLDAIYFNDNSTQSLIRIYLTLSLAKTQGSLHVRINQRILLNYFILYTGK